MTRQLGTRMPRAAALLTALLLVLSVTACSAGTSERYGPGDEFPPSGVPVAIAWPSDWLEGTAGEDIPGIGGEIVAIRLEYREGHWMWRVTSADPAYDGLDDGLSDPTRGREALLEADTRELVQEHYVTLTEAELKGAEPGILMAARNSGETWPNPRVIELRVVEADGSPVWEATMYDANTREISVIHIDPAAPDRL
ncbi:hypothetical protein [Microbacterium sp. NPDC057650]|uniref:hypothetical protein n=1 Tax=unclassified Microbacterium TaxID=2609290 RepID=UPI00366CDE25